MGLSRLFTMFRRGLHDLPSCVVISPAVRSALHSRKGVVALESTVITHGLPYPDNLNTAKLLEDAVRSEGSEPATIALLDGNIHVGLSNENLTRVAETMDSVKVSRRDIVYALNKGLVGGTTVAATMFLAHMAGIRVFATGGIGGVHRGVEETFDISADLIELMQTPVTVVCAGVKSILDIPKTLQFLETHSVNCIVYGEKNAFPGFFTKETTEKGQFSTTDLHDVVQHMEMSRKLGLKAGTILACPIPDKLAGDGKRIEEAIVTALKEAKLGCNVSFVSAIGDDQEGKYFLEACPHIDNSEILVCDDLQTAKYFSINVGGEVRFGISAIGNIVERITPDLISSREELISSADYVLFDSNIATRTINRIVELTKFYGKKAWFEPTDIAKMCKIFDCSRMDDITFVSPNANEFREMVKRAGIDLNPSVLTSPRHVCDFVCSNPQLMYNLDMLIVTLAAQGTAIISRDENGSLRSSSLPPPLTNDKVLSVSGAGDSLNSGILAALAYRLPLEKCLQVGQRCAALTLQTVEAVSPQISSELLRI